MTRALKVLVGAFGFFVAVVALTPQQWSEQLSQWRGAIGSTGLMILCLIGGAALGAVGHRLYSLYFAPGHTDNQDAGVRLISAAEYEAEVRSLIESEHYRVIKIFGYTGETVLADLFRFDDRYRGNLEIRFLHRNWVIEADDEARHNASHPDVRPWKKSDAIRALAAEDWEHPLRRQFRYYGRQPFVKGMILCKPRGQGRIAYVSFFRWVENPDEGGSVFKGTGMSLMALADDSDLGKNFIDNLDSQFEYEWSQGAKLAEVQAFEERSH